MFTSPSKVRDVMTGTVVALGRQATFKEIASTMDRWNVSALPVLEGDGRVVGVVSEADLLAKEALRGAGPADRPGPGDPTDPHKADAVTAEQLMTSPAVCVHADATVAHAARIMARRALKRLPVIDAEGVLRGIVSRGDLLKVFLRDDAEIADEVRHEVVERLFPGETSVTAQVSDGRVSLTGTVGDAALIPAAVRLARAVEGVVDVTSVLRGSSPPA